MHTRIGRHESGLGAPKQLHRLHDLMQQDDAEGSANELNLDPRRTREWFEQGLRRGQRCRSDHGVRHPGLSRIMVNLKHR
jgi:hypothetical protein